MNAIGSGKRTRKAGVVVAVLAALFAALTVGCATRAPAPSIPTGMGMPTSQSAN